MSKFYAALVAAALLSAPLAVQAAEEKMSAADIQKKLEAVASDPEKLKAYCAMSKKMDEIGDDEKKAEAAGDEIEGYFKTLGEDFQAAWDAGQDATDGSPEANAMDAAMSSLDEKCK
jgi:predicted metal-dependent peptidase